MQHSEQPVYPESRPKGRVLLIIAGIAIFLPSVYLFITPLLNFFSILRETPALLNSYPWASVIFGLVTIVLVMITGVLALVFSQKPKRAFFLLVAAGVCGALVLIRIALALTGFISLFSQNSYFANSLGDFNFFMQVIFPAYILPLVCLGLVLVCLVLIAIGALINRKKLTTTG